MLRTLAFGSITEGPNTSRADIGSKDDIAALAATIESHGLLQPLVVCDMKDGKGTHQLVAGFRRWAAIKLIRNGDGKERKPDPQKFKEIETRVVRANTQDRREMNFIENFMRRDLSPMEIAATFKEFRNVGLSQTDIAARLHVEPSLVSRHLKLLEATPAVAAAVENGRVSVQAATTIARLPEAQQDAALAEAETDAATTGRPVSEAAVAVAAKRGVTRKPRAKAPAREGKPVAVTMRTVSEVAKELESIKQTAATSKGLSAEALARSKASARALEWVLKRRESL